MKNARRSFLKKGSALAILSMAGLGPIKGNLKDKSSPLRDQRRMKIALQASTEPTEDQIKFIQQMGLDQVVLWTDASKASFEYYDSRRKLYAAGGTDATGEHQRNLPDHYRDGRFKAGLRT